MVETLKRAAELKRQHPDTILFFRRGDFYEVFADDARLVAQELQITLTSRPTGAGDRIAMAGVPYQAVDQAIARLIARGKVAVAEQLTAPITSRSAPPMTRAATRSLHPKANSLSQPASCRCRSSNPYTTKGAIPS